MKNDMPELKACPFCGGEGELYEPNEDIAVISCLKCNAESGYYDGEDSTTPDDAILFWNKRADLAEPKVLEDATDREAVGSAQPAVTTSFTSSKPVIDDGLREALSLISEHGFEKIDFSLQEAVKTLSRHALKRREKMTDAELQRIESIAFTFDNPQSGVVSSDDIKFLIRGYREALKTREKPVEVTRERMADIVHGTTFNVISKTVAGAVYDALKLSGIKIVANWDSRRRENKMDRGTP